MRSTLVMINWGKGLSQADRRVELIQACKVLYSNHLFLYVRDLQGSTLKHLIETPHSKVFFSELVVRRL